MLQWLVKPGDHVRPGKSLPSWTPLRRSWTLRPSKRAKWPNCWWTSGDRSGGNALSADRGDALPGENPGPDTCCGARRSAFRGPAARLQPSPRRRAVDVPVQKVHPALLPQHHPGPACRHRVDAAGQPATTGGLPPCPVRAPAEGNRSGRPRCPRSQRILRQQRFPAGHLRAPRGGGGAASGRSGGAKTPGPRQPRRPPAARRNDRFHHQP